MAITNDEGFNSLDPLGPEYGRINQPVLDSKGLSAFEGERLEMPKINFPSEERYFPVLPNTDGLNSPQRSVREQVVGYPPNKPGAKGSKQAFDFNEFKNAYKNNFRAQLQTNQDKNAYAKVYAYDAGPDSNAFYKRYQAYGQDTFDKIGFSPLRDNEALFNSRTNWWDDHKRMMTQSFWPLFGRGFVSGPKSLGKMLSGDFTSSDIEDAEFYSEAAAIGQSSKGGFGAFANNTIMNFGYSAGIMSEAILEEVAGALLAPVTGGGSFIATTANASKNILKAITGLDKAIDGYKAVNATLKSVNNVAGARKFWQAANKIGTSSLSPLGNTVKAFQAAKNVDNLTNLGKGFKTFGGFYRDVQRINMALSEARLEGGMVKNEIYDKLYNQYYAKNGKAPSDQEQYAMIKQSEKGSLNTVLWNTALIYGSNAITFPNIMGPKGGIRNFIKNSAEEFATIKGGKFGDLGKVVYNKTKKGFEFEANNFKNMAKSWLKQPIYKSATGTVGYFKSNFAEGIQENLQEVIAGANERYYLDSFNSSVLKAHNYAKGSAKYNEASQAEYFGQELGKQFTATGFETFASGFAMGALAIPVNATFENLAIGYNKMFDKEAYQDFKEKKLKATEGIVQNLNSIDIKEFFDSKTFNYSAQDAVAGIKKNGTAKQANDASLEGLLSQVFTAAESGTLDLFKEKIKDLGSLTPEEFEDAIPTIPKGEGAAYQSKISNTLESIDKVKKKYDYYSERFPNPIDYNNLPDKNTPEYADAVTLNRAWDLGIKNAVFFNEAFEDTLNRKKSIMETYLSKAPLKNMTQRDSEVIFDYNKLRNEQGLLKEEIDSLEGLDDPESKRQLEYKKRKLQALQTLGDKTSEFNTFYNRYERADEVRQFIQSQKGDNEPVTDEEVEEVLNNSFGEFNDENKTRVYSEHEAAYKDYLRALASLDGDHLFDQDIDDSYQLLADHFKLGSESRNLMKYINLLHDPNEFVASIERNQQWMKNLYNRRGSIYEKMVKEQLDLVINNSLLNALANDGVYISLEEFENWDKNGEPPTEFFDNARKIIIPETSPEYNRYYMLFEQAANLKEQKSSASPETFDAQLKADLENVEAQLQSELADVPKKEVKVTVETLKAQNGINITLAEINNKLSADQYVAADYEGEEPLVFFKDEDGNLRLDNEEGEIFAKPSQATVDFVSAEIYTLSEQADPEIAKPIIEKYEALKNKIREDYADMAEQQVQKEANPIADFVPVTTDIETIMPYPGLYNTLYKSFEEKVLNKMASEDMMDLTDDQVDNLFARFLKSDKGVKNEIDKFNQNQKLVVATQETGEKGEFEFTYQGKKRNTADIATVPELRKLQRRFKALINDINEMESPAAADITNRSNYKILVRDFEKLIATRSRKGLTPDLREAMDKIEAIKEKQGAIEVTEDEITIDGEVYQKAEEATGTQNLVNNSVFNEYVNQQVKNLFDLNKTPSMDPGKITQEAYDNLFGTDGYLTALKTRVDNGEISIIGQDLIVYDPETKIASTIQLLVADSTGNLTIIDAVADSKSNWDVFKKKDNPLSKLENTKMLMATKANLLNKMIGAKARVAVLPIEMSVTTTDNKILMANKPSSPTLMATDFLISLNTADVQSKVDSIVPTEKQTVSSDIDAKKAEIEKRRNLALEGIHGIGEIKKGINKTYWQTYGAKDGILFKSTESEEELINEINAKYDAELAALKITDIDTEKTDIERRRQEELISAVTTSISYQEFVNTKPDRVIVNNFDVYEYDKNLKKYVLLGAVSSTDTSLESIAAREEGAKDVEFFKDKSLKLDTVNFFWSERTTGRSPITRLTNYKKRTKQGRIDETVGEKLVEINAKYDVELAALEPSVVPANAESSDDVQSPAVEAGDIIRKEEVIDDAVRYRVNDLKADLAKVSTRDELQALLAELSIKTSEEKVALEDLQEMSELVKAKAESLKNGETIKIVADSLAPGGQLIAKNIIFTEPGNQKSGVFAEADDTVVIESINKKDDTATISSLGTSKKMTLGVNQLDKLFTVKDVVMDATQKPENTITAEDQIKIVESTDLADTFVKNSNNELDRVEGTASSKSLDELDEELLEDIEC